MFGKRKPPPAPPQPPTGGLSQVIVPRSSRNGHLPPAVVDFVRTMLEFGDYTRTEIPPRALQIHDCAEYIGQVKNGGHSQFIHNDMADFPHILPSIRAGLVGMSATDHIAVLDDFIAWMKAHPGEASKQTGFSGGRAPELDELDRRLYAIEKQRPLDDLAADWIVQWPELRIVEDAEYRREIEHAKQSNPLRKERQIFGSVAAFEYQLSNWQEVGVGLACSAAGELKLRQWWRQPIKAGDRQWIVDLSTSGALGRLCLVDDEHAALYRRVAEGSRELGERLSYVEHSEIAGAIHHAQDHQVAVALDLLLRRAEINPHGLAITPNAVVPRADGSVMTLAMTPSLNDLILAVVGAKAAVLVRSNAGKKDDLLAQTSPSEMADHRQAVERGR